MKVDTRTKVHLTIFTMRNAARTDGAKEKDASKVAGMVGAKTGLFYPSATGDTMWSRELNQVCSTWETIVLTLVLATHRQR